ncbi:amino acid permease [Cellulomonas sp. P22]|uniref:amino acid permease n=1 Tax=Cellulomonas sp. P22 TaxID=3373189 RepID=UPI003794A7E7
MTVLTVVAVVGLRSAPAMAPYGLGAVVLLLVPALVFLVPTALVVAELGSTWTGGVYVWVREALGPRWGLTAVWLQWVQGVVWYPVQLAFIAASVAYVLVAPDLATSGVYTAVVVLALFWGCTLVTMLGGTLFARLGAWGGVLGTLLPAALLVALGGVWLATGERSQVSLSPAELVPPYTGIATVVLVMSNVLAFTGIEVNAVHVGHLRARARGLPRAVLLGAALVVAVVVLPPIAVSLVVERADLGATSGANIAFGTFLGLWDVPWALQVVSALLAVGALASVLTWVAGPSRGLEIAGRAGLLPPSLQRRNARGTPTGVLLLQGAVVSVLAVLFVVVPDPAAVLALLVGTAAALYLVMYMMVFVAAVTLRRTHAAVVRGFRTPGMPAVATIGFAACLAAFFMTFIPPAATPVDVGAYPWLTAAAVVLVGTPPLLLYRLRRPGWDQRTPLERDEDRGALLAAPALDGTPPP